MLSVLQILISLKGPKWLKKIVEAWPTKELRPSCFMESSYYPATGHLSKRRKTYWHFQVGCPHPQATKNRLWICRSLCSVLKRTKRLFGVNHIEKWSCADLAHWEVGFVCCGLPSLDPSSLVSVSPKSPALLALTLWQGKEQQKSPRKTHCALASSQEAIAAYPRAWACP